MRRKLFLAALFTAAFFFVWIVCFKADLLPAMPVKNAAVTLTGKINKIEEKESGVILFLSHAKGTIKEESFSFGHVILTVSAGQFEDAGVLIGNRISAECLYVGFGKARNRGNFDEEAYYRSMGIAGKFQLKKKGSLQITDTAFDAERQWLFEIKKRIRGVFLHILKEDANKAGIFAAIVLGDRSGIESDVRSLYQKNGIAHILAVSGLHISLIGMSLFRLLRRRFYIPVSAILSGSVMVLFCILSGGSPSAIRATVMFLLRMAAQVTGKTFDLLSALSFAGLMLILMNPLYLTNTAFLLSFGAILGLGLISSHAESYLAVRGSALKALIASLSVFLMTAPILMGVYYEISLFSVLLNLAVIPLMSLILGSGIMGGVSGLLSLALARFAISLGTFLLSFVEILCRILDYLPFLVLITGAPGTLRIVFFYGLLLGGIAFFRRMSKKKKILWRRISFGVWVLLLLFVLFLRLPQKDLQISFFDVDQGESILIEMPSGEVCLIDGGSTTVKGIFERRMESAIKQRGIAEIDYVFLSHTDSDHISGVLELLQMEGAGTIHIRHLCLPEYEENENQTLLQNAAQERSIPVTFLSAGMAFSFGEVQISCLHPFLGRSYPDANAASAVLSLTYGDFSALFTGDLEQEGERELLRQFSSLDHDLLKVGHHGSRDASSAAFLGKVSPQIAVISAGVRNRYGHPHKEVRERLVESGADIYVTAEHGQVSVRVDRNGSVQVTTMF